MNEQSLDRMMQLARRSGCVLELVFVGDLYFGPRFRRPPPESTTARRRETTPRASARGADGAQYARAEAGFADAGTP